MEWNFSLSARIRRRNKFSFNGIGTIGSWIKTSPFGDYTDINQNNKMQYYIIENARKNKLGFKRISKGFSVHNRALTKKFADNHQKMS